MPNTNYQLNPQALAIYQQLKDGTYLRRVKLAVYPYRYFVLAGFLLIFLLVSIRFGISLSRQQTDPAFTPPAIDIASPQVVEPPTSIVDATKQNLVEYSVQLPEPAIPVLDSNITLDPTH